MDAFHLFGFSPRLCLDTILTSLGGLPLALRHFLDGGTKGYIPPSALVAQSLVPALDNPPQWFLWHLDIVQSEGLFPCRRPRSLVYCPLYCFPNKWVAWPLALPELLQLYQLPLLMDAVLRALEPDKGLPFEDSPAPNLFASVFQQLWGASGGGSGSDFSAGDTAPNLEKAVEDKEMVEDMEDFVTKKPVEDISVGREIGVEKVTERNVWMETRPVMMPQDMMVDHRPDLWGINEDKLLLRPWHFDFGNVVGCGNEALTDKETVTSAALAESLCCRGLTLEPHKIQGKGCVHNPGPPFAVRDVILCNVGNHGLQRAFVRLADDPWYQLYLPLGVMVETSLRESWLAPCLDQSPGNLNNIAEDQDDPWESVRSKVILGKGTVK
jgi:hypothetical protein